MRNQVSKGSPGSSAPATLALGPSPQGQVLWPWSPWSPAALPTRLGPATHGDCRTISLTPYSFSTFTFRLLKHSSMRSWKGRRFSDTLFSWILIPAPRKGIWRERRWTVSQRLAAGPPSGPGPRSSRGPLPAETRPGQAGPLRPSHRAAALGDRKAAGSGCALDRGKRRVAAFAVRGRWTPVRGCTLGKPPSHGIRGRSEALEERNVCCFDLKPCPRHSR